MFVMSPDFCCKLSCVYTCFLRDDTLSLTANVWVSVSCVREFRSSSNTVTQQDPLKMKCSCCLCVVGVVSLMCSKLIVAGEHIELVDACVNVDALCFQAFARAMVRQHNKYK